MEVLITDDLRQQAVHDIDEMHGYMKRGFTPKVKASKRCNACSIKELCLPRLMNVGSVEDYIDKMIGGNE